MKWQWLTYNVTKDRVFCFQCAKAYQKKLLLGKKLEQTFISEGFDDWKRAIEKFQKHEKTDCHIEAVYKMYNDKTNDIGEVLSNQHQKDKEENRRCLLQIVLCLRYLARQGIALRGNNNDIDGNFHQLLKLQAYKNKELNQWLDKKRGNFTSPDIQNEILKKWLTISFEVLHLKFDQQIFSQ